MSEKSLTEWELRYTVQAVKDALANDIVLRQGDPVEIERIIEKLQSKPGDGIEATMRFMDAYDLTPKEDADIRAELSRHPTGTPSNDWLEDRASFEMENRCENQHCPCGNQIIREGETVMAHWLGRVCQECEATMFEKNRTRAARPTASPDQDFLKLLDDLISKAIFRGRDGYAGARIINGSYEERQKAVDAARQSLVDYVAKLQQRSNEGYQAHANSARALFDVAYLVNMDGVDDYSEVPKKVDAALSALKEDALRLDWIEKQTAGRTLRITGDDGNELGWSLNAWRGQGRGRIGEGVDLREAIDAARKEEVK